MSKIPFLSLFSSYVEFIAVNFYILNIFLFGLNDRFSNFFEGLGLLKCIDQR